jgi:hypothetical protein
MNRHNVLIVAMFLAALLPLGCQSTPQNRGQSGGRLDPTHDSLGEVGSTSPRSAELVNSTDKMAQDIAQRLDINNPASPPRIVLGPAENKTSMPQQNFDVFLARLRAQLQSSGVRHGVEFIKERRDIEYYRDLEYGGKSPGDSGDEYTSAADYMLVCEVFDLPSAGTNYFLFDFQLVQLRESPTGPNVRPGSIVWENSYEVKYQ